MKQVSRRTTRTQYVHKCIGLTKHIRQNQECSAYYSSNGLTQNRVINLSSSMLGNPKTHQTLHSPSSFGLSATGNAPVVARHPQVPSSTNNGTPTPSIPITQSPHYRSSSSNRHSQQIQRVIPNMLQAPIDRSVIQDYFSAQSSNVESQSNNDNLHLNQGDDTTLHTNINDDNDFPMQFDTTEDQPPAQPDFSSTHYNDLENKRKSIPVHTPRPGLLTEIELMDILNQHKCPQIVRRKNHTMDIPNSHNQTSIQFL